MARSFSLFQSPALAALALVATFQIEDLPSIPCAGCAPVGASSVSTDRPEDTDPDDGQSPVPHDPPTQLSLEWSAESIEGCQVLYQRVPHPHDGPATFEPICVKQSSASGCEFIVVRRTALVAQGSAEFCFSRPGSDVLDCETSFPENGTLGEEFEREFAIPCGGEVRTELRADGVAGDGRYRISLTLSCSNCE